MKLDQTRFMKNCIRPEMPDVGTGLSEMPDVGTGLSEMPDVGTGLSEMPDVGTGLCACPARAPSITDNHKRLSLR